MKQQRVHGSVQTTVVRRFVGGVYFAEQAQIRLRIRVIGEITAQYPHKTITQEVRYERCIGNIRSVSKRTLKKANWGRKNAIRIESTGAG
jgi:hypothetical protein